MSLTSVLKKLINNLIKHRIAKHLDKHSLVQSDKQGLCNGKSQFYTFLFLEK